MEPIEIETMLQKLKVDCERFKTRHPDKMVGLKETQTAWNEKKDTMSCEALIEFYRHIIYNNNK